MQLRALLGHLDVLASGGDLDVEVSAVSRDSRHLGPETLFVAIRGAQVDGHDYVPVLSGLAGVVVSREVDVPEPLGWIRVPDTRRALAQAAAAVEGSPGRQVPVVGITGTNGKTTVSTLLANALEATGDVAGRIGTTGVAVAGRDLPADLTTPEAPALQRWLREMHDDSARLVAMEASSIGLHQHRVDGIPFAVAVFTNLGHDHLDFHGTMDAYAAAKARLFEALLRPAGGLPRALLCGDDPAWRSMHPPADRWLYGFEPGNDLRILDYGPAPEGLALRVRVPDGDEIELRTRLIGRHNALNAVAAFGAGVLAGVSVAQMQEGLAAAEGPPGRLERVPDPSGERAVFVDYAHTPGALTTVLEAAREVAQGQVWVVFGCGGDRDRAKRPEMGRAALSADHVVVTSDNPRSEDPQAIVDDILPGLAGGNARIELDRREAIHQAVRGAAPGDVVVIAGKGHETTQVVGDQVRSFDDRVVAAAAMEGT